ncbi:MAG: DoxX family protein [Candidatus Paceibacterota bacterium]
MDIVFLIGRIVFGLIFVFFGVNHFMKKDQMVAYAASQGVGGASFFVPATGLILLLGGLSVATGVFPQVGLILLILFLVPTSFIMHRFWGVSPEEKMQQMPHFMKNMALAAAALALLFISLPWPLSL